MHNRPSNEPINFGIPMLISHKKDIKYGTIVELNMLLNVSPGIITAIFYYTSYVFRNFAHWQ